jgi:type II secretory pathway pseudopilin PulG
MAFSLVELLVVLAVIPLLIALLLPALGRAKQAALHTACLSNLRQIGQAFTMYAQDWKAYPRPAVLNVGSFPYPYCVMRSETEALASYGLADDRHKLWHCPASRGLPPGLHPYPRAYGNPGYDDPPTSEYFAIDQYAILTHFKGVTGYSGELSPRRVSDRTGPLVADAYFQYTPLGLGWWSNHGRYPLPDGINQIFSDGHGQWVQPSQLPDTPMYTGMPIHRFNWSEGSR